MSEQPDLPSSPFWFRPRLFLVGLALGIIGCVALGHYVARRDYHAGFTRFHPRISPESSYYPTVDEMCSIVRARCRPDQILVIVGGNSILNGVGQPAEQLWTRELQRLLGDKFAVINLAFRGAMATDGGAVIAEVLRKEFPRQIYVANMQPMGELHALGLKTYQFIFWEAHYRGLLENYAPREKLIETYWTTDEAPDNRLELAAIARADALLRYRDLWNWVGFEHVFTVSSFYTPTWPKLMTPRKRLRDQEPDYEQMPFVSPERFSPDKEPNEMAITRGFTSLFYEKNAAGEWSLRADAQSNFITAAQKAFPDSLKGRTLLVVSRNSPIYRKKLTPEESRRDDLGYQDTVAMLESLGYRAMEYGKDFAETDFGDRTHLTVSGGRKLAALVAAKVEETARRQGYQP
jgi:hypothetical protein